MTASGLRSAPAEAAPSLAERPQPASTAGFSEFGAVDFDAPQRRSFPGGGTAFDVCHVGVVLRAVLFVHAAVAIGMLFGATTMSGWLSRCASGAAVALPAVLMWLLVLCGGRRVLAAASPKLQWLVALGAGAASAALASLLIVSAFPDALGRAPEPLLAPTLAGAALAAVIFHWLALRAKATVPAGTTARLAELQSRIRPHFLFNTLNTALTLIRLDPTRAESVLEDLAELFRVAIADTSESVSLAEEVALAQRYLAIEQVRFGNRLHVNWELDPDAGSARVPPLLLQPLVENAVRHGIEPAPDGGVIRVRTGVRLGRAVVSIANSVPDQPSRPGSGMALRNVRERLRLMHDVAAQFEARRDFDVFRVQIVVPL